MYIDTNMSVLFFNIFFFEFFEQSDLKQINPFTLPGGSKKTLDPNQPWFYGSGSHGLTPDERNALGLLIVF